MQRKKYEQRRGRVVYTIEPNMFPSNPDATWHALVSTQNDCLLTGHSAASVLQQLDARGLLEEAELPRHIHQWDEEDWP